jgi:hypothetical protein
MRVGIHDRLFVKNVCAIGLSAGFIEPLESNGLLSVHEFLISLIKIMKRGNEDTISQWDRDNFNVETCKDFLMDLQNLFLYIMRYLIEMIQNIGKIYLINLFIIVEL